MWSDQTTIDVGGVFPAPAHGTHEDFAMFATMNSEELKEMQQVQERKEKEMQPVSSIDSVPAVAAIMTSGSHHFLLGNRRRVQAPHSNRDTRAAVLDALRTVTPSLGCLVLGNHRVDLIIHDFFFEGGRLRMMVILLDTFELFDAVSLRQDLMHLMRVTARNLTGDHDFTSLEQLDDFGNYFIKCQQVGLYQPLDKAICAAARNARHSPSLLGWFEGKRGSLLQTGFQPTPPVTYKAFPQELATQLLGLPSFPALEGGICPAAASCNCTIALNNFQYQQATGKCDSWSVNDLLPYLISTVPMVSKTYVGPCVAAIKAAMQQAPESKAEAQMPEVEVERPKKRTKKNASCCLVTDCNRQLDAYWTKCCHPDAPVACHLHARKIKNGKCPIHKVKGPLAIIHYPAVNQNT